jgi:uncharacterized protein YciI
MRHLLLLFAAAMFFFHATAQSTNPKYDKQLADSLRGDDYGMKLYVLVILKTGTNTSASKQLTDSLFRGHMKNINKLVAEKKLVVAGPLKKNEKAYRGIFILDVRSIADAKELLKTDPAVEQNLLDAELFEWYGSAALPLYIREHKRIEKKSF